MKDDSGIKLNRRGTFRLVGAAIPLLILSETEAEAAKLSKKSAHYIEKSKNQKKCRDCKFFTPPNSCKVVNGNISPEGWCMLFASK